MPAFSWALTSRTLTEKAIPPQCSSAPMPKLPWPARYTCGGTAYIFQDTENAWILEPKISVQVGFELPNKLKVFGSFEDILTATDVKSYGVGFRYSTVDIRAVQGR